MFKYAEYVIQIDKKMLPLFDKRLKLNDESRLGESSMTLDYNKTIDHDLKKTTFISQSQSSLKPTITNRKTNMALNAAL